MELVQAQEKMSIKPVGIRIAGILVQLSLVSLGIGITLIPWRFAWILQQRQQPPVFADYTNPILFIADLPLLLAMLLWLISLLVRPTRINLQPHAITFSLAGLLLISALSSISSVDPVVSRYHSIQLLLLFGFYLYLINALPNLSLLWIPAGLGVLIQALVAFGQIIKQHSLGLSALHELPLDPLWKGVSIVLAGGTRTLRAYGLTDHPNILAGCLAFAMLILMAGFLKARHGLRILIGIIFLIGAVALLLTFSRGAWLGLSAGLILIGLWLALSRSRQLFRAWVGLCAITVLLLLPFIWHYAPFLSSRLNLDGSFSAATPENQSINERWLLLSQAVRFIAGHPLTGVGLGAYPQALHQALPNYPFDYQPPHMVLAEVTAETGLPGGVVYLVILAAPWLLLLRSRNKLRFSLQLAGVSALLLAVNLISMLDYYPWLSNAGSIWQWLCWGLWGGVYQNVINGREV
jgi:putative inorganic carbon (hco3(-)) transporter